MAAMEASLPSPLAVLAPSNNLNILCEDLSASEGEESSAAAAVAVAAAAAAASGVGDAAARFSFESATVLI